MRKGQHSYMSSFMPETKLCFHLPNHNTVFQAEASVIRQYVSWLGTKLMEMYIKSIVMKMKMVNKSSKNKKMGLSTDK